MTSLGAGGRERLQASVQGAGVHEAAVPEFTKRLLVVVIVNRNEDFAIELLLA